MRKNSLKSFKTLFAATLVMLLSGSVNAYAQEEPEIDKPAEYPGGTMAMINFISQNLKYPQEAKEQGIQGRVMVLFTIQPDGKVTDVQVKDPVHPLLDAEAIRVVSMMPAWTPALKADGTPVISKSYIPMNFRKPEPVKDVILVKYEKAESGNKAVTCTITYKEKLSPQEQQSVIRMEDLDSKLKELGKKGTEGSFVLPNTPRTMQEFNTLQDALNNMKGINVTYKQD